MKLIVSALLALALLPIVGCETSAKLMDDPVQIRKIKDPEVLAELTSVVQLHKDETGSHRQIHSILSTRDDRVIWGAPSSSFSASLPEKLANGALDLGLLIADRTLEKENIREAGKWQHRAWRDASQPTYKNHEEINVGAPEVNSGDTIIDLAAISDSYSEGGRGGTGGTATNGGQKTVVGGDKIAVTGTVDGKTNVGVRTDVKNVEGDKNVSLTSAPKISTMSGVGDVTGSGPITVAPVQKLDAPSTLVNKPTQTQQASAESTSPVKVTQGVTQGGQKQVQGQDQKQADNSNHEATGTGTGSASNQTEVESNQNQPAEKSGHR